MTWFANPDGAGETIARAVKVLSDEWQLVSCIISPEHGPAITFSNEAMPSDNVPGYFTKDDPEPS